MEQIFKDWSTYIVGIPSIFLALLSIYLFYKQKNRKKLSYINLLNENLVNIKGDSNENIKITYDGKPAENLKLIVLNIFNAGNLPILTSDFESDIIISFNVTSKLINTETIKKHPNNIDLNLEIIENKIHIKPLLLNTKDFFTIKILINSNDGNFSIDSRIVNIDNINEYKLTNETKINNIFQLLLSGMLTIISVVFVFHHLYERFTKQGNIEVFHIIVIGLGSFMLIYMPYIMYYLLKNQKNNR